MFSQLKTSTKQFFKTVQRLDTIAKRDRHQEQQLARTQHAMKVKDLSQLMGIDYARFSSILPYRYYDSDDNLYINDQSIGFGFELAPLTGANEEIIHAIADMIKTKVKEDISIQIMLVGSNKVGDTLSRLMAPYHDQEGMFQTLATNQYQYLKHAAIKGFDNKRQLSMGLKDYRCFLFASKRTGYTKREAAILCDLRDQLSADLKNTGIYNQYLQIENFLPVIFELINPSQSVIDHPIIKFDKHKTLDEQCVSPAYFMRVQPDYLEVESEIRTALTLKEKLESSSDAKSSYQTQASKTRVVSLSLKQLPEELALWMQADNFSNIFKPNQGIECPFVINVHFKCEPQERSKLKAYKKASGYEKKANSAYSKLIPGTIQAAQDWKKIRDDLLNDEIKLCKVYFNCLLFTNDKKQKEHVSSAISAYRLNGIDLYPIKYQQLQSYLSVLPFSLDQGLWFDLSVLGRLNTMTTWNLANMLPLVAEFKGSQHMSGVFAPTFRHQATAFDIFDATLDNYNACICATSGSGKSVLSQAIMTSVLAQGGCAWVIDLGQSYKKFCETLGGTYMDVSNLKLNPFSGVSDIARSAESIRDLIVVMASPEEGLSDVQKAHLLDAVHAAYQKKENQANIDDVIEYLQSVELREGDKGFDIRIGDIVTLLKKFSLKHAPGDSICARIFNQASLLDTHDDTGMQFVVLELGELESQPDLLKSVLFALILHIEEQMYHSEPGRKKLCVIDEAWRLLSGSNKTAANFIEKGFRTARKHNGAFLTITQKINDFYASSEAQAAWSCAENKIIMRQNEKSFKDFLSEHEDYFDAYQQALIKNFKPSATSGFSEFMVQQGSATSFHRLFLDPFSRIMFSSKAEEHQAVKELTQSGLRIEQAIQTVASTLFADEIQAVQHACHPPQGDIDE